jgi:hypothetical protein
MNTKYHMIAGMALMLNVLLYSGMVPFEAETYLFPIVACMMLALALVAFAEDWRAEQ